MKRPTTERPAWEAPVVSDLGSLEELTAVCDTAGGGDATFPGETDHNTFLASPFCASD